MQNGSPSIPETDVQRSLRALFNEVAAKSLAVDCRLDAEPEMAQFLAAAKAHPEEREFVVGLFLDSLSPTFHLEAAPTDLLMYCMSDLRWQEIHDFVVQMRDEDIAAHGVASYAIWNEILKSF